MCDAISELHCYAQYNVIVFYYKLYYLLVHVGHVNNMSVTTNKTFDLCFSQLLL